MHRRLAFGLLLIASVVCNEKVAIVFVLWLTTRWILCPEDRQTLRIPWIVSIAAIAVYVAIISIVQLPGYSYQLRPAMYPFTFWENLTLLPTARGILLNIVPVAILSAVAVLGWKMIGSAPSGNLFRPIDILVVFEMAMVAMIVTHEFQMGRLVMHAAPLYALPVGIAVGNWLCGKSRSNDSAKRIESRGS
jgi:hypothetical protein